MGIANNYCELKNKDLYSVLEQPHEEIMLHLTWLKLNNEINFEEKKLEEEIRERTKY